MTTLKERPRGRQHDFIPDPEVHGELPVFDAQSAAQGASLREDRTVGHQPRDTVREDYRVNDAAAEGTIA